MQTVYPVYTREATESLVKIIYSTYAKLDLEQIAARADHLKAEERTQLLRLYEYFEELFDGNLGDWYTSLVDLELNTDYKLFNCKYYPVPRINKWYFAKSCKD